MAAHCIAIMKGTQDEGPYQLCGFSSGGVVAFEMAHQLIARGEEIGLLALVDTINPTWGHKLAQRLRLLFRLARGGRWRLLQERLYHLVLCGGRLSHWRDLRTLGEAHRWALWSYAPRPYPGKAILFKASKPTLRDTHLGWHDLVQGGLDIDVVPATHGIIVKEPAVEVLVMHLRRYLNRDYSRGSTTTTYR